MFSNSSRLRCRLRNAAARFLTSRASRLLMPETSGGMKSLVAVRSPRAFLELCGVQLDERLDGTRFGLMQMDRRGCDSPSSLSSGEGADTGMSKTWLVGTQSSGSELSGLMRLLSMPVLEHADGEREM